MSRELTTAIARAARDHLTHFAGSLSAREVSHEPWASITFTGARQQLELALEGAGAVGAAADLLAMLPDLEVACPGHIVADLALVAETRRDDGSHASLRIEVLTIVDE